jgi:integrase
MSGLRLGELLGLRIEDIDFSGRELRIRRQLRGKLKTKKSKRDVRVSTEVLDLLRDVVRKRREDALRAAGADGGWLFAPNLPAKPSKLEAQRVARWIREDMAAALKRAGLAENTPHGLRHTYGSRLASANQPIQWIQRQMGHSSIKVTIDLYGSHLPIEPPPGALEALSDGMLGAACNKTATFAEAGAE